MGMAAPDVVLFVVGFLLFGGAVTALVVEGGPSAFGGGGATNVYSIDFATKSVDAAKQAVADYGVQQKASLNVTTHNVSVLHVVIQCSDPAGALPAGGFNIQVTVQPPAGIPAPAPKAGTCGQPLKIDIPITNVPPKTNAAGNSPEDAVANMPMSGNHTAALGTWVITTNGARSGAPVGLPAGNPSGTILLQADVWEAKATVVPK